MNWVRDVPRPLVRTIGTLEMPGAIGPIAPAVTGILPWLTPPAAAALAAVQVPASASTRAVASGGVVRATSFSSRLPNSRSTVGSWSRLRPSPR